MASLSISELCHDHCTRSFVGENLRKQGVAFGAADNVRTVHAAAEQFGNVLQFGNHSAGGTSVINQSISLIGSQSGELCFGIACVQVDAIDIGQQNQFLSLQLNRDFGGNGVGIDVKYGSFGVGPQL